MNLPLHPSSPWVDSSLLRRKRTNACKQNVCIEHELRIETETITFEEFRRQIWGVTRSLKTALEKHGFPDATKKKVLSNAFDELCNVSPQLWRQLCAEAKRDFDRIDRFSVLPVSTVTYYLRHPLKVDIAPLHDRRWEFSLEQFTPQFVGQGDSIAAAHQSFLSVVHAAFQSLVRMRPFQMNAKQLSDWGILNRLINVERYWATVPLAQLETGAVIRVCAEGFQVVWLDGGRREFIPNEQTLPQFATFKKGQWFEAMVERKPNTYKLIQLRYVHPIKPIKKMSDDDFCKWLESLPRGEDLPKSKTDWPTL